MYDNEMPTICQSTHPKQTTKDKRECDENLLTCGFAFPKKVIGLNGLESVQKTEAISIVI